MKYALLSTVITLSIMSAIGASPSSMLGVVIGTGLAVIAHVLIVKYINK